MSTKLQAISMRDLATVSGGVELGKTPMWKTTKDGKRILGLPVQDGDGAIYFDPQGPRLVPIR